MFDWPTDRLELCVEVEFENAERESEVIGRGDARDAAAALEVEIRVAKRHILIDDFHDAEDDATIRFGNGRVSIEHR